MELKRTGRRRFSPMEREELLVAYRRSGPTQRGFASRNDLSLSCLVLWLRKFGRAKVAKAPGPFLPLPGGGCSVSGDIPD